MVKIRQTGKIKKNSHEAAAWQQQAVVIGIDEVGRGCIAGPVVAAAVMLPLNKTHRMLKDSKIMTAQEREKAFGWIAQNCMYGVGIIHHRIIDQHNIYHATLIAMKKALINVLHLSSLRPTAILTDAMPLDLSDTQFDDIPVYYFPKGESKSSSIAAASIAAKVTRDAMMAQYDHAIPGYVWASNKGYRSPVHKRAVKDSQHSIIHRMRYLDKLLDAMEEEVVQLRIDEIPRARPEPAVPADLSFIALAKEEALAKAGLKDIFER
ncbi:MAG TPA: ribonuclease HII [Candidatus Babeliales bacterium]|nr:ribonuclease HII [Candidatus Babeliales bacterium]